MSGSRLVTFSDSNCDVQSLFYPSIHIVKSIFLISVLKPKLSTFKSYIVNNMLLKALFHVVNF